MRFEIILKAFKVFKIMLKQCIQYLETEMMEVF